MIRVTIRSLFSRKLRTILTMFAIVLGVSMISGTFILTDTINTSFDQIFKLSVSTTDVIVSSQNAIGSQTEGAPPPGFPAHLLEVIRGTPGVAAADGLISDRAILVGANGQELGSTGGAPTLLVSRVSPRFRVLRLVRGHYAQGPEVNLDVDTMARHRIHLGQQVGVVGVGALQKFTVAGGVKFGDVGSLGGASIVSMDLAHARSITGKQGRFDQIRVAADSEVTALDLAGRIRARIPADLRSTVKVETAQQNAAAQSATIASGLSSLTDILLAFGFIALFVGAFVIFNTFSITVAQRAREFALLRTLGATRSQVLRSVVLEALLVGLVASLVGLAGGFGIAKGLNAVFKAAGIDLPTTALQIQSRTIIVAMIVGVVVTLLSSIMPAIRATRVPPIAALREGASLPASRFHRFVPPLGGLLAAAGIGMMAIGIFASIDSVSGRLTLIGAGALSLFLGTALLSPRLIRPLALLVGWPVEKLTHITGRLARENVVRNPGRTAVTAAALMVGLALVGFVTIFAAELKKTALDVLDREIAGTYAIYNDQGRSFPEGAARVVRQVPGVTVVSSVKVAAGRLVGIGTVQTNGIQPSSLGGVYHFQWKIGSNATLRSLGAHQALIDDSMASNHHLRIGSALRVITTTGRHDSFRVAGIYKASDILPDWCIRLDTLTADWRLRNVDAVLANAAPGQNLNRLKHRIQAALLTSYPTATVHSQQDLKDQNTKSIDLLLNLIYVLLAMSVLVSLFGIINTLVLSIYERTREIGMLRAIGTTRTQVRSIIVWESVNTSVIGAVLGLLLGIILAVIVTAGLQSQGLEYALPVGNLLVWVVFAVIFGMVAAVWPAWRAARLDVLRAIAYE